MVRRAETMSLEELGLSKRARAWIDRKELTSMQVVELARRIAFFRDMNPDGFKKKPVWQQEITVVLDAAGFIRHDLDRAYHARNLYNVISDQICDWFNPHVYENRIMNDEQFDELARILSTLTEVERRIIILHYGLGGEMLTLEEIGRRFNTDKEVVRQFEAKALQKLRHPVFREDFRRIFF